MTYEIKSSGLSLRNNILRAFFIALLLVGITINIVFLNLLPTTLSNEGLNNSIIENISRHFIIIGAEVIVAVIFIILFIVFFLSKRIIRPIENTLDKLRSAKEYSDNILISVPSILIVLSNRLNILSTNKAFKKLKEQFPSLSPEQFITPMENEIRKNLKTGETIKKEIILVPEENEISLIFSVIISPIGNNKEKYNGEKASVLLTITDIMESKRMKELVFQHKQDWENTFNTIPDSITIHDKDFNIIHANKAARELLNLPLTKLNKMFKCYKYYHGTDSPPDYCPSCECYKTEMPITFELYEPHLNKYIEIRSIPRINNRSELIGLIHIVRDISLRKEIEQEHTQLLTAITKAKIEWEMTFNSVTEFIVIIDKDLKITRCNNSFAEFVGKQVCEIIGKNCYDFFPCPYGQIEDCKDHINTSQELLTKNELRTETGRWLYINHRPIQDEKAKPLHFVITAIEITELKNIQERLKYSEEKLKQKVHDLEKFYDMAIGRELRMKELKKEIKRLRTDLLKYETVKN